jgi:hypothetical protein
MADVDLDLGGVLPEEGDLLNDTEPDASARHANTERDHGGDPML